jgi:hypothetical protein
VPTFEIEDDAWSAQRTPMAVNLGFLDPNIYTELEQNEESLNISCGDIFSYHRALNYSVLKALLIESHAEFKFIPV